MDALCEAHCYLLHPNDILYRQMCPDGQSKFDVNPFLTEVIEEGNEEKKGDDDTYDSVLSIDLGQHVLQWLPFGVQSRFPSFRAEILGNPDSNLDQKLWESYHVQCAIKIEEAKARGINYEMDELLCLKIYTDTNEYQAALRKAHWKRSSLEQKRNFYQWAITMYRTFLFHAVPPNQLTLYHGLNSMFTIEDPDPLYNGPFSTTYSQHVAQKFHKRRELELKMGVRLLSNPLKLVMGINMESISCFPNEHEVLLYSQIIPIASAEAFDQKEDLLIHHLLSTVMQRKDRIPDRNHFFRKIGFKFDENWLPKIATHLLLPKKSQYEERMVLWRLWEELEIDIDTFPDEVLCKYLLNRLIQREILIEEIAVFWREIGINFKPGWTSMITKDPLHIERTRFANCSVVERLVFELGVEELRFHCNSYRFRKYLQTDGNVLMVSGATSKARSKAPLYGVYTLSVDGHADGKEYTIDDILASQIPIVCPHIALEHETVEIRVFVHMQDPPKGFEDRLLIRVLKTQHPVGQYMIKGPGAVEIDSDVKLSASTGFHFPTQVQCQTNIFIAKDGSIEVGGRSKEENDEKSNVCMPEDNLRTEVSNRTGGSVMLISGANIINYGRLQSNGVSSHSQGIISFYCSGIFQNEGLVQSIHDGLIFINCAKFINHGIMSSPAHISILENYMKSDRQQFSNSFLADIPLTVYRHRGHHEDKKWSHPRNLLDKKGTETEYWGDKPAEGDWIIFKIESPSIVIPKAVIIRNSLWDYDLKSISLSLSVDGDEFEDFAVIQDIEKKKEEQYFNLQDVMMSSVKLWMNNYKFIKLQILSNWGATSVQFHSFSLLGAIFTQNVTDEVYAEYFLKSVKCTNEEIEGPSDFMSEIGVHLNESWYPFISNLPLVMEK